MLGEEYTKSLEIGGLSLGANWLAVDQFASHLWALVFSSTNNRLTQMALRFLPGLVV